MIDENATVFGSLCTCTIGTVQNLYSIFKNQNLILEIWLQYKVMIQHIYLRIVSVFIKRF